MTTAILCCFHVNLQATLAVLDDITARIQMLSARPTQLDEFVNYMVRCTANIGYAINGASVGLWWRSYEFLASSLLRANAEFGPMAYMIGIYISMQN
jgi:hypothetical protein